MLHKQIKNFISIILFYIDIFQSFSYVNLTENQHISCFMQVGVHRKFVNPYRNKITVGPYGQEKTCKIACCSKKFYCATKQSSCSETKHSGMLNCNCANNLSSCSGCKGSSCTYSNSSNHSCPKNCNSSCFELHSSAFISCKNLSPNDLCLTFPRFKKNHSKKNCKCCTQFELSEDELVKIKNEAGVFGKFNESSEITTESESSEIADDIEINVNKTSNSTEAKFSYDIYLAIMDKYPLLSLKRRNYARMRQNLMNLQHYGLWEIPRNPENLVNATRKIFSTREQYLGLTTNHTDINVSMIQFTNESFLNVPRDFNYMDNNSAILDESNTPTNKNWEEWEKNIKKSNQISLRNKLEKLSGINVE
ncbi:unnamed protein product [Cryptosporidium hominis]|uniref:Uncharacterized protein n=1 Tax=Cryptosporidium hominis TaxID=237895 RepID=A0A0S4TCQ9_CRYHO|nr:unnamed protein product [Cryptosporidium hominis]